MSVTEMQACLGRLYVDDMFRELFLKEAEIVRRSYELSDAELAALAGIDRKMLAYFASSLKNKRRKRLAVSYPGLFSLNEREIQRYYIRFYELYMTHQARSLVSDILQFGTFMEESLAGSDSLPAYATEIARFEKLHNSLKLQPMTNDEDPVGDSAAGGLPLKPGSRPRLRSGVQASSFCFDVVTILERLRANAHVDDVAEAGEEFGLVFERAGRTEAPRVFRLTRAAMTVLELCDGRRTVTEIIKETEASLGVGGLEENVISTLERILKLKVIRI